MIPVILCLGRCGNRKKHTAPYCREVDMLDFD